MARRDRNSRLPKFKSRYPPTEITEISKSRYRSRYSKISISPDRNSKSRYFKSRDFQNLDTYRDPGIGHLEISRLSEIPGFSIPARFWPAPPRPGRFRTLPRCVGTLPGARHCPRLGCGAQRALRPVFEAAGSIREACSQNGSTSLAAGPMFRPA